MFYEDLVSSVMIDVPHYHAAPLFTGWWYYSEKANSM